MAPFPVPEVPRKRSSMYWNRHISLERREQHRAHSVDISAPPKTHFGSAGLAPEVSRLRQSFSCCSASANELNFSPHERHGNSLSSMFLRSGTRGSFFISISATRRCATGMPRWTTDPALVLPLEWLLRLGVDKVELSHEEWHRTRTDSAVELLA
jgi:hypothetical protein